MYGLRSTAIWHVVRRKSPMDEGQTVVCRKSPIDEGQTVAERRKTCVHQDKVFNRSWYLTPPFTEIKLRIYTQKTSAQLRHLFVSGVVGVGGFCYFLKVYCVSYAI